MTTQTSNDNVLRVTESAAKEVQSLLGAEGEGKQLRIFVEGGGCSGMKYGLVFDEVRSDDLVLQEHGVSVLIDPFSVNYLKGSVIDFSDSLTGGGFKISNPNARQSCGCGKSFEA